MRGRMRTEWKPPSEAVIRLPSNFTNSWTKKLTAVFNPGFHGRGVYHRRAGSETPLAGGVVAGNPEIRLAANGRKTAFTRGGGKPGMTGSGVEAMDRSSKTGPFVQPGPKFFEKSQSEIGGAGRLSGQAPILKVPAGAVSHRLGEEADPLPRSQVTA